MMPDRWLKQTKAVSHIRELISQRKLDIPSHRLALPDDQQWIIFEYKGKQLGVDSASGLWIRESELADWRCISMPCTVSGALQAVEFISS